MGLALSRNWQRAGARIAVYELVDHWTVTCDASEYLAFMNALTYRFKHGVPVLD